MGKQLENKKSTHLLRCVSGPVRAGYGVMTLRPAQRALPRLLQPSRRVLRGVPGDSPVAPVAYASEAERVIAARQQSEPPIRHPLLLVNNLEADAAFNLGGCRRAFVLESKPLGLLLGHGRRREHVVNGCRLSRVNTRLNLAAANLRREGRKRCKDRLLNYKCVLYTLARGAGPNGWFSLASCRRPSQTSRRRFGVETKRIVSNVKLDVTSGRSSDLSAVCSALLRVQVRINLPAESDPVAL